MLARFKSTTGALKFLEFHRQKTRDFTRNRKLTFELVVLVILQKSVKSLQLALNEFFQKCSSPLKTVGASAFTKARQKLSHTAFIELNQVAVVETVYEDSTYRQWKGHRLLGVDGSKIILPDTPEIREEFGGVRIANQLPTTVGSFPMAVASVCYDSLNHIALDSVLTHARAYEVDLAMDHFSNSQFEKRLRGFGLSRLKLSLHKEEEVPPTLEKEVTSEGEEILEEGLSSPERLEQFLIERIG